MTHLEQKELQYIITAKFTPPIQHIIDRQDAWMNVDEGIDICNKTYRANAWEKERRKK